MFMPSQSQDAVAQMIDLHSQEQYAAEMATAGGTLVPGRTHSAAGSAIWGGSNT